MILAFYFFYLKIYFEILFSLYNFYFFYLKIYLLYICYFFLTILLLFFFFFSFLHGL